MLSNGHNDDMPDFGAMDPTRVLQLDARERFIERGMNRAAAQRYAEALGSMATATWVFAIAGAVAFSTCAGVALWWAVTHA